MTDRVVLVHGTMDRASSFAKVVGHLRDLDVITYDRRGYGNQRHRPPVALEDHIDELLSYIGDEPAVVVGHSIGGDFALAAACRRPDLVRAIGAWEAPLAWLPWWPEQSAGTRAVAPGLDPGAAAELFMRGVAGDETWERLPAATQAMRRQEGTAMLIDVRGIRAAAPFDAALVKAPVVTGRGGASKPYHRRSAEWLVDNVADAELFDIAGASHGAHASHPQEFAAFVRRVVARARD
ncbi:MAG TPA: alpha/beta hydrolase [Acidimicrobiales bacterium]|nr:alpha/beta hydrolase [Acidimicrobiales bacterium]